ncbi:MAG: flavodoxin-dependent (E)-4-hydroxy-3-methylbut-2-enyl-diphosphate synthase [Christensenellaceae bacterium]
MVKEVRIRDLYIGGNHPVALQTMLDVKTSETDEVLRKIDSVYALGCDIIRMSVKDDSDAEAIKTISKKSPIPVVCDIHFDYRLALKAISNGADKIRINPGNIGSENNVEQVARAIKSSGVAVRVGSNSGSIEKRFLQKYGKSEVALAESALKNVAVLERYGVENIVISLKASDVALTVSANRYISKKTDYPLHIGVTESGTLNMGIVKSAIGIGSLLLDGIGSTMRVSLTAPIEDEIIVGKRILRSVGLDKNFAEIISCPTCGRTSYDSIGLAGEVEKATASIKKPLKIAVMGCVVNGPGEAKDCDIGIAGGGDKCVIFRYGEVYKTVDIKDAKSVFLSEIEKLV